MRLVARSWSELWIAVLCVPVACSSGASEGSFDAGGGANEAGASGSDARAGSGGAQRGGGAGMGGAASASSGGRSQAGGGAGGAATGGAPATGGASPTGGAPALPPEIRFDPPALAFSDPQEVRLSALEPGAELFYTVDGSLPTRESPRYTQPIRIEQSTRLRASAYLPNEDAPIAVLGATYLKVEEDAENLRTHLPIVVIHTFGSGQLDPEATEHVSATLSVFEPDSDGTSWLGRADLDTRIGVHVRGQSSRNFPKKQYAVEFRGEASDDDRSLSFLGMPPDSDWVISDPIIMDRSLIRNAVAFEISNRIGRYAPRTRFAEAFLVDDGGSVTLSKYLGFYTVIEKIKRGRERVNIDKLDESETTEPGVTGGYIVSIDKGEPDFVADGQQYQYVYPDRDDMSVDARAPQRDYVLAFLEHNGDALWSSDFKDPVTGRHYSEFMDVDSFVDHNIVNALTKNVDGLRISTYFHKDREKKLVAGPVWDFDRSLGTTYDHRATDARGWFLEDSDATDYLRQGAWGRLFEDPTFKDRYRARFLGLLGSTLSPEKLVEIVDALGSRVGDAAQRDYERWSMHPESGSHAAEIQILKDFLIERVGWLEDELGSW